MPVTFAPASHSGGRTLNSTPGSKVGASRLPDMSVSPRAKSPVTAISRSEPVRPVNATRPASGSNRISDSRSKSPRDASCSTPSNANSSSAGDSAMTTVPANSGSAVRFAAVTCQRAAMPPMVVTASGTSAVQAAVSTLNDGATAVTSTGSVLAVKSVSTDSSCRLSRLMIRDALSNTAEVCRLPAMRSSLWPSSTRN